MASINDHGTPDPQVEPRSAGPRRYSAEYKARILAEYETLDKKGKGALLRREGLYSSLIANWREQRDAGAKAALAAPAGRPKADPRDKEMGVAPLEGQAELGICRLGSTAGRGDPFGTSRSRPRVASRSTARRVPVTA
ncbi:hypothetical protein [Streptomyces sp. KMM 9044]|uniref:hypothetical protein n=1 Tax=Streptomyces sp. KMM 9044 TaxID=2744474 RepID=UPI00216C8002